MQMPALRQTLGCNKSVTPLQICLFSKLHSFARIVLGPICFRPTSPFRRNKTYVFTLHGTTNKNTFCMTYCLSMLISHIFYFQSLSVTVLQDVTLQFIQRTRLNSTNENLYVRHFVAYKWLLFCRVR